MTHSGILLVTLFTLQYIVYGEYRLTLGRNHTCHSQLPICRTSRNILRTLESDRKIDNFRLRFVNDTQCGQDPPKILLTSYPPEGRRCFTPEGFEGTCINIKSCDTLKDFLEPPVSKKHRNYVNSHRCDDRNDNLVCCINCSAILGPPHPKTGCCGRDKSGEAPNPDVAVTSIHQYPWMVLIEYDSKYKKDIMKFKCGGALISSKYVLSTAECFFEKFCSLGVPSTVVIGEYDLSVEGPDCVDLGGNRVCTDGAIRVPIETVLAHHSYRSSLLFDIALVRLQYNVPYTDFVRPICLPTSDVREDDTQTFYVTGFGYSIQNDSMSIKKLHVDVPFFPLEECKTIFNNGIKWEGIICAGGVEGRGACAGDAGGPLMSYHGFYELIGIVSFAYNHTCGIKNIPVGFTKIFYFLPWIRSLIGP